MKHETWNSIRLRSNLLRLQCTCCTVPTTSGRPHGSPLVWACQWPSSKPLSSPQLSHNDSLWAQGIIKSHGTQGLDYREGEELSWCPTWSNSLWQGWNCWLVHCPDGNATDPIWRVLASSNGISCWTPLNLNIVTLTRTLNLWPINSGLLTSLHPSQTLCLPCISYATQKLMLDSFKMLQKQSEAFHTFLWPFSKFKTDFLLHIVLLNCPHVQIAFLKFRSGDNQALVGCIPIASVAVYLNLKS